MDFLKSFFPPSLQRDSMNQESSQNVVMNNNIERPEVNENSNSLEQDYPNGRVQIRKKKSKKNFTKGSIDLLAKSNLILVDLEPSTCKGQFQIEKYLVYFPFERMYVPQVYYINYFLTALEKSQNALLQSPTGTGKTLCIISAACAWLKAQQEHQGEMNDWPDINLLGSKPEEDVKDKQKEIGNIPKLIYCTRTHQQIKQIIAQFRKSSYRPLIAILGSKTRSCVPFLDNQIRKKNGELITANELSGRCRQMRKKRQCEYHKNLEKNSNDLAAYIRTDYKKTMPDLEDLVEQGRSCKFCPYYFETSLIEKAHVVICPYNYILDPFIKQQTQLHLNNSILVFDEAHNIADIAQDSYSFKWSITLFQKCLKELKLLEKKMNKMDIDSSEFALDLFEIPLIEAPIKMLITQLSKERDQLIGKKIEETEYDGKLMIKLLQNKCEGSPPNIYSSGIHQDNIYDYQDLIMRACDDLAEVKGYQGTLGEFYTSIRILYLVIDDLKKSKTNVNAYKKPENYIDAYRIFYKKHQPEQIKFEIEEGDTVTHDYGDKMEYDVELLYQCVNPAIAFENIQDEEPRSIILTSGTLEPMSSFSQELGIEFEIQLKNQHVIHKKKQIYAPILTQGPNTQVLDFSYQKRQQLHQTDPEKNLSLSNKVLPPTIYEEAGLSLLELAKNINAGILVVFASYNLQETCFNEWMKQSTHLGGNKRIYPEIKKFKQIYQEPKDSRDMNDVMELYLKEASGPKGAILCCVCRGKVTEGIDFSDEKARAVVLIGLPNANISDKKLKWKQAYLNSKKKRDKKSISGNEWYKQNTMRAVNQAVGRVIRSVSDYGVVLFFDQRYQSNRSKLSDWLQANLEYFENFDGLIHKVTQFLTEADKFIKTEHKDHTERITVASIEEFKQRLDEQKNNQNIISNQSLLSSPQQQNIIGFQMASQIAHRGMNTPSTMIPSSLSTQILPERNSNEQNLENEMQSNIKEWTQQGFSIEKIKEKFNQMLMLSMQKEQPQSCFESPRSRNPTPMRLNFSEQPLNPPSSISSQNLFYQPTQPLTQNGVRNSLQQDQYEETKSDDFDDFDEIDKILEAERSRGMGISDQDQDIQNEDAIQWNQFLDKEEAGEDENELQNIVDDEDESDDGEFMTARGVSNSSKSSRIVGRLKPRLKYLKTSEDQVVILNLSSPENEDFLESGSMTGSEIDKFFAENNSIREVEDEESSFQ